MALFGFLGKKASKAADNVAKSIDRDFLQAAIAGSVLVMFADGEVKDEEVITLQGILEAHDKLSEFGSEIGTTLDKYMDMMKKGATLGRIKLMREIEEVKGDEEDAIEVFAILIDVSQADGEMSDAEITVIKSIATKLPVRLSDFGIE